MPTLVDSTINGNALNSFGFVGDGTINGTGLNTFGFIWDVSTIWSSSAAEGVTTSIWVPAPDELTSTSVYSAKFTQSSFTSNFAVDDSAKRLAQSFTTTDAFNLGEVSLLSFKSGTPQGSCFVAIYSDNGGVPGTLLGTSDYLDMSTLAGTNGSPASNLFTFSTPVTLSASTKYHFITGPVNVVTIDGANNYRVKYSTSDVFTGGNKSSSSDSGSTWTPQTTEDVTFVIYSVVGGPTNWSDPQ